uniref:Putative secreted protein n=1 Tax=Ixodes ricinus TaxID=34613 RepID=A0A6B0UVL7_IXORI
MSGIDVLRYFFFFCVFRLYFACQLGKHVPLDCSFFFFFRILDSYILHAILGTSCRRSGVAWFRSNRHLSSSDNFALHCSSYVFHQLEAASICYGTSQPNAVLYTTKLVHFKLILICAVWFLFTCSGYIYMYHLTEALQNVSCHWHFS